MTTYFVPSLGDRTCLTDPRNMMTEFFRTYARSPSNQSEVYRTETFSLSNDLSKYTNDPTELCSTITKSLTTVLTNIFPNGVPSVSVTTATVTESYFTININMSVMINGVSYGISPEISVKDGNIVMPYDTLTGN